MPTGAAVLSDHYPVNSVLARRQRPRAGHPEHRGQVCGKRLVDPGCRRPWRRSQGALARADIGRNADEESKSNATLPEVIRA